MTSVVKHLRSTTAGHTPTSLVSGQIAINEADGKIFWLDSDGTTIRSVTVKGLDTAVAGKLAAANNLSDVASASTARTNLGLGSAATLASSAVAQTANNLSDLASAATARTNLGLGSAATLSSLAVCQTANNLSDVSSPTTARGNLGITSIATVTPGTGVATALGNATNGASGVVVLDASSKLPAVDGSQLTGLAAGATGGGSDQVFWNNGQTVSSNYTVPSGKNAGSFGPITIGAGVTVTVSSGSTWSVV